MELMMPKQTTSSSSSAQQPSEVETHQLRHGGETPSGIPVSKCLQLKLSPGGDRPGRQSPDRDLILRRIRHHRWANKVRDTAAAAAQAPSGDWRRQLDAEDAFFSP